MIPPLLPDEHPLLAKEMPPFDFATDDGPSLAKTLRDAMLLYGGIGLAANQIGIEKAVFAMETMAGERIVLFNPMVTWLSTDVVAISEGCLSFPGLELKIRRPADCQVSYQNELGKKIVTYFTGMDARCALHEMDHLAGIVFTSKVSKLKLALARKKQKKRLT